MLMAGFLPFSAIYVELYYIFASVWGHKVYIIWSILLIVYIILIIVTAFITVALTYFQVRGLNAVVFAQRRAGFLAGCIQEQS
jgi:hypothetical protein